jgi:hypothetical protein
MLVCEIYPLQDA